MSEVDVKLASPSNICSSCVRWLEANMSLTSILFVYGWTHQHITLVNQGTFLFNVALFASVINLPPSPQMPEVGVRLAFAIQHKFFICSLVRGQYVAGFCTPRLWVDSAVLRVGEPGLDGVKSGMRVWYFLMNCYCLGLIHLCRSH
jgi:hypothetical protein